MRIDVKEAGRMLSGMDNVVILTHLNPDGDTLGSAFALYNALKSLGKNAVVKNSEGFPSQYEFLYKGYEEKQFPEENIVAVDIADAQLFGANLEAYKDRVILCIDHHKTNSDYAKYVCVDHEKAAACEIIYEVILAMGAKIDKQTANCLYTGIATDTGCFKFSNTSANTHRVAAALFEAGAEYDFINQQMFIVKKKSRIEAERLIMDTMEFFFEGRVAVIAIRKDVFLKTGAEEAELDGIAGLPRSIEGVQIGVTVKEKEGGKYKISLRTSNEVDASVLCSEFGGGGHARAAGCTIMGAEAEVKAKILEKAKEYLK